jgi:hypothetical protein
MPAPMDSSNVCDEASTGCVTSRADRNGCPAGDRAWAHNSPTTAKCGGYAFRVQAFIDQTLTEEVM